MTPQEMDLFVAGNEEEAGVSSGSYWDPVGQELPKPTNKLPRQCCTLHKEQGKLPASHGLNVDRDAGQGSVVKWLSGGGRAF